MPNVVLNRSDLTRLFPNNPKAQLAFEQLFRTLSDTSIAVTTGAEATQALQDATVLTLSTNEALANERVLAVVPTQLQAVDTGATLVLSVINTPATNGGYPCTFNLLADTNLDLPVSGSVLTDDFSGLGDFVDDAAAAVGGVAVGHLYRTASAVKVRVA